MGADLPSKSKIRKAGEIMRLSLYEPVTFVQADMTMTEFNEAAAIVLAFRRAHQEPMTKARNGFESMIRTTGIQHPVITQRLKRTPRIIRKLHRTVGTPQGSTKLDRLEDIGGVRAVLPNLDSVEKVVERIGRKGWLIRRERDYVSSPQISGYWARHIVVERDGRWVELQLRTPPQQQWADAIEAADSKYDLTLKDGTGPESMTAYFSLAAKMLRANELGHTIDRDTILELGEARRRVVAENYYTA